MIALPPILMSKESPSNLAELVRRRAADEPGKLAYRFLEGGDCCRARELTYAELHERTRRVAGRLQETLAPGDRALLLYPPGLDFVTAFSAVGACLNNLGPGLGDVATNYADLSAPVKWILIFTMLLGRLEIFTFLVLLTPAFWRR